MHNAERTGGQVKLLNCVRVTSLLGARFPRANSRLRHPPAPVVHFCFLGLSQVQAASLYSLIGGFVFPFPALLLLMPPSR